MKSLAPVWEDDFEGVNKIKSLKYLRKSWLKICLLVPILLILSVETFLLLLYNYVGVRWLFFYSETDEGSATYVLIEGSD